MSFDSLTQYPRTYQEQVAWLNQFIAACQELNTNLASGVTYTGTQYERGRNIFIGGDFLTNPWQRLNHDEIMAESISNLDVAGATHFYSSGNTFFGPDMWYLTASSYGSGEATIERSSDAPTTTQCGLITKSAKVTSSGGVIGLRFGTRVSAREFLRWFGDTSQLSFWVKCNKAVTLSYRLNARLGSYTWINTFSIGSTNTWVNITDEIDIALGDFITDWSGNDLDNWPLTFEINLTTGASLTTGTLATWQNSEYEEPSTGITTNGIENGGTDGEIYFALMQLEKEDASTPYEYQHPTEVEALCKDFYSLQSVTLPDTATNVRILYSGVDMYKLPSSVELEDSTNFSVDVISYDCTTLTRSGSGDQTTKMYVDVGGY